MPRDRRLIGHGGDNPPLLLVVGAGGQRVDPSAGPGLTSAVKRTTPGARVQSFANDPALLSRDGRIGVVVVYPRPPPRSDAYAATLPALQRVAAASGQPVTVTGVAALQEGSGRRGAVRLVETLFGGIGALVVLLAAFGSALALMPLLIPVPLGAGLVISPPSGS